MKKSHFTPEERIDRIIARVHLEAKRKRRGPLFHLLFRAWELEHDSSAYEKAVNSAAVNTSFYSRGARDNLGFAIAILMKYKHATPGCTLDEVHAAINRLDTSKMFAALREKEHLPVPAGIA